MTYKLLLPYKPKCMGENNVHKPDYLVKLYQIETGIGGEGIAFSWCKECGVASVDMEMDGRFAGKIVSQRYPDLSKLVRVLESERSEPEVPEPK